MTIERTEDVGDWKWDKWLLVHSLREGAGETRGKNSFLILFRRIITLVYYIGIYIIIALVYMHIGICTLYSSPH